MYKKMNTHDYFDSKMLNEFSWVLFLFLFGILFISQPFDLFYTIHIVAPGEMGDIQAKDVQEGKLGRTIGLLLLAVMPLLVLYIIRKIK